MGQGEIVNEIQLPGTAQEAVAVENMLKNKAAKITKLNAELRAARDMFNDSFTNNATYRTNNDKVNEAARVRNATKAQILRQPQVAKLSAKVNDLRFDLKETKKSFSVLLLDYKEKTNANQLELFEGQLGDIVVSAKWVSNAGRKPARRKKK